MRKPAKQQRLGTTSHIVYLHLLYHIRGQSQLVLVSLILVLYYPHMWHFISPLGFPNRNSLLTVKGSQYKKKIRDHILPYRPRQEEMKIA